MTVSAKEDVKEFYSLRELSEEWNVTRNTILYRGGRLGIAVHRFPLDQNLYIAAKDVETLRTLMQEKTQHNTLPPKKRPKTGAATKKTSRERAGGK